MSDKQRLNRRLADAATLRLAGDYPRAAEILAEVAQDPGVGALGPVTSLGMPRRLQAAHLRLAKAEGDALRRIGYQFHLVPPPAQLAPFARFTPQERRDINHANRQPVPHVLHQIWIGDQPVPPACAAWADYARARGYDYRLWRAADLEQLGVNDTPVFAAMLARGDYPGAVDIARYAILARDGGIYLDCDWYPARRDIGFHDLLPLTGLTALAEDIPRNTGMGGLLLANSMIATPPDHPVLHRLNSVLDDVVAAIPGAPAWWSTGPLIFTMVARAGAVALAGNGLVAGTLPRGAPFGDVEALRAAAPEDALLIAWKSW
ncbi:mannosyltransferase [Pseudooceanicola sediminis]|uniref:Mannosyltransferase n=1 Tax=Pseudooceanicola sediminis TaxID=2211117 RepID=A0A399J4Y9_9RHOB|nr:glycosyltransferase [Pseudooceanicola sediminis]RII37906.1 mannosyltransferase [Pseudooceanicola sediminis]|tara:strand:- start:8283 stop:9239 length:957 start_codon:yes stop_codon:yes gene_type:complete